MIDIDLLLTIGATYKKVTAGEVIFFEGNRCDYYYQLTSGKIRWTNTNEDGKEYLQMLVEPGECFGELPLFDGGNYAANAIASTDSVIIKLHKCIFHQLLTEHPEILMAFSKLLAERIRFKFFLLKVLLYNEPEERIKSLMTYLKDTKHNFCSQCGKLKLTRQEIANMTCLRIETVIRAMRNMNERGEISIQKGKVFFGNCSNLKSVMTCNFQIKAHVKNEKQLHLG